MSKRRHFISLLFGYFLLLLLAACGGESSSADGSNENQSDTTALVDSFLLDTLKGIYFGDFGGKDIRIVLSYVSEGHATGYDLVSGLQRNISGKVNYTPEYVEMELSEPGDDKNDGVFKVSIHRQTLEMKGTWTPINPNLKGRTFKLHKMEKPEPKYGILNAADFASVFGYVSDTIGNLSFNENGKCLYSYYPAYDSENRREQLVEIAGSWTFKKGQVTVAWKPNDVFPESKTVFKIYYKPYDESKEYVFSDSLVGADRTFFYQEW